jgi:3-oxoacyl-[acyl-carrier-protein] synthase-3
VPKARVRAIAAAVPKTFVDAFHFATLYGADEIARIDKASGVTKRPRLQPEYTPVDLALASCRAALGHSRLPPSSLDGVIYVTQSGEFVLPATACILQHRLEIPIDAAAFDVNLGCSGFVYGCFLAANLVRAGARQRVLVVAGDAPSRGTDDRDRSTAPLFGDAFTATIIEASDSPDEPDAFGPFKLGTDGSGWANLIQPVGMRAYRDQADFEKRRPKELENVQNPNKTYMNGEEVFAFTLQRVPPLVASTLQATSKTVDTVDYFVYHQANKFMLEQLRRKSKIPPEKFLYSIGEFANTSSATIPLTLCHALAGNTRKGIEALVAGFGVGYSWGAVVMRFDGSALGPIAELG